MGQRRSSSLGARAGRRLIWTIFACRFEQVPALQPRCECGFLVSACVRHPCQLLQQPLSARCLRILLKFRMGCHSLPNVSGRWARVPRPQRLCMRCAQQVLGDERHLVFECPALQSVRDRYPGLFGAAIVTMQQFMWQLDIVGVAHFVMDCFDYLDSASSSNQP